MFRINFNSSVLFFLSLSLKGRTVVWLFRNDSREIEALRSYISETCEYCKRSIVIISVKFSKPRFLNRHFDIFSSEHLIRQSYYRFFVITDGIVVVMGGKVKITKTVIQT